jgi:hypothetical protein
MYVSGSQKRKSPIAVIWLVCLLFSAMMSGWAWAQDTSSGELGETEEAAETAERIRVLEAQKIRQDERASLWGGTGLAFTRTAVLLPRKHFNVSGYFNYSDYTYIQGWREWIKLDDPRQSDYELNVVADYGLTHFCEVSMFMNFFLQDEQGDADQLHMRSRGIGRTGLNGKFRLMDIDKDGLGIASTFFLRLPSPMKDALITSTELNYGAELNVSIKLMVVSEWLEKFTVHGNFGYAHLDYFDTQLAGLYQFAREYNLITAYASNHSIYRQDYEYADLFDATWGKDDVKNKNPWLASDHYTGSFAVEYRPIIGLSLGVELVGFRMIRLSDDNLLLAPYATYTFRQIPFLKKVHKQILTATLAGNWGGLRELNRASPAYGVVFGLTYHTDLIF